MTVSERRDREKDDERFGVFQLFLKVPATARVAGDLVEASHVHPFYLNHPSETKSS